MEAKAFFSNQEVNCRLEILQKDGHTQHVTFENTCSLVGYCNLFGIEVPLSECHTEE